MQETGTEAAGSGGQAACAIRLILSSSRGFVLCVVQGDGCIERLKDSLSADERDVFDATTRVWDLLLRNTSERFILHSPDCPCISIHERAVLNGLRCLRSAGNAGYAAAMSVVLPPAAVRLIRPEMQDLADALMRLEGHYAQRINAAAVAAVQPPTYLH